MAFIFFETQGIDLIYHILQMLYPISSLVDSRWIFGAHVPVALARAFLICTFRGRLAIAQIFKVESQKIVISIITSGCFATTKKRWG